MSWRDRIGIVAILAFLVAVLFHQSFKPEMVLFSSDGPLGILASKSMAMPEGFTGWWFDSTWLGTSLGAATPNYTFILLWLLGPLATAKFLAPLFVLVLGVAAAFCFRVLGFRPMVCLLGGIAAELNSNFFSNACWGVGTRCSALAATFLAIAAIWSSRREGSWIVTWIKLALAGFATGMAVMEGADNGAIFSLFVAAFAFYVSLVGEGSAIKKIIRGAAMVAVIAACAGFISYQTVRSLVGTQIVGKANMEQTTDSRARRWNEATMWSLSKLEVLRVVIPGLFGYRMDTPDGGEYWGGVGADPRIPEVQKQLNDPDPRVQQQAAQLLQSGRMQWRHSGAGEYGGVLVVLIAVWGLVRSLSRKAQTFSAIEKKMIWFWTAMGVLAVLLAWGHYAPFYQFFYRLPYASTIRNPMKFMHVAHMTLMILFAYGLQGLAREYLEPVRAAARTTATRAQGWWAGSTAWEKRWTYGCIACVILCTVGWMVYSGSKTNLVKYMSENAIGVHASAADVAKFSVHEVGWFVLLLAVCIAAVLAIQAGMFRGSRAGWAAAFLGVILFFDFWRADAPWPQYYDYKTRYVSNPVLDVLKDKPWEHRTTILDPNLIVQDPALRGFLEQSQQGQQLFNAFVNFWQFHRAEWMQHQFQYFNIHSLDVAQDPRPPVEKAEFIAATGKNISRYWQLTNTRYIFAPVGMTDVLNQHFDPVQKRFRQIMAFAPFDRPGTSAWGIQTNQTGPFALMEFTGALPRAKLYSQWRVSTNDTATLATLGDSSFNPDDLVLVDDEISAPAAAASANGTVEYVSYTPKRFEQLTSSTASSVLLVNDKYDNDWKVTVDGKPEKILRCNFLMRGVPLPAGQHTLLWSYHPDVKAACISWSGFILALLLCGVVSVLKRRTAPRRA